MNRLLSILFLVIPLLAKAATYPNYYVTNANPGISGTGTNAVNALINVASNNLATQIQVGTITNKAYASNIVSGGVLSMGTVSATTPNDFTVLGFNATANTRDWQSNVFIKSLTVTNGPTNNFTVIGPQGIGLTNAASYFRVQTNGVVIASGNIVSVGNITAKADGYFFLSGRSGMYSPTDGTIGFVNQNGVGFSTMFIGNAGNGGGTYFLSTNWPSLNVESATNNVTLGIRKGTNLTDYASLTAKDAKLSGIAAPTNGVFHTSFSTNQPFTTSIGYGIYCVNGTNQLITLHNATLNPWVLYRFVSTNGNGNFTLTNATGDQTIRDGASLSLKNIGVGEVVVFSDGANWQIGSKFRTVWPNAQFSCLTNIPLSSTARAVSFNSVDFNNSQGIALLAGTNWGLTTIWITNSGIYEFGPSIIMKFGGNNTTRFWFKRGAPGITGTTNIPNSSTFVLGQNLDVHVVTVPFIQEVRDISSFKIWAISSSTDSFITNAAAGTPPDDYPLSPSIICPVKRISDSRP